MKSSSQRCWRSVKLAPRSRCNGRKGPCAPTVEAWAPFERVLSRATAVGIAAVCAGTLRPSARWAASASSVPRSLSSWRKVIATPNLRESISAACERMSESNPSSRMFALAGAVARSAPANANILELGFDSLILSQAALMLSRKFGVAITFRQLLKDLGTLEALAAHLALGRKVPAQTAAIPTAVARDKTRSNGAQASTVGAHGPFRPLQRDLGASLTERQQRWLDDFIGRYNARTAASKRYTQQHRRHLADPRAVAGFKQAWKEIVYPIVVERSAGAKLWDIDSNEWVDITLSFGAAMLGHQP